MSFSVMDLIPTSVKIGLLCAVIAGAGTAVYQWRADIMQVAYDRMFRQQVQQHLNEQNQRFEEFKAAQKTKTDALQEQLTNQQALKEKIDALQAAFDAQHFQNVTIDPGLKFTFDQIRELEAKKPAPPPAQKPLTTLELWKRDHK